MVGTGRTAAAETDFPDASRVAESVSSYRLLLAGTVVCTGLGLLFASHYRLYYGIDWISALWWGLKDWYLWGGLAPVILCLARRAPLRGTRWLRNACVHLAAALAFAVIHPVLAVSLSSFVEGLEGAPFLTAVQELILKRYAMSLVTYAAVVGVGQALAARRSERERPPARETLPEHESEQRTPGPTLRLFLRSRDRGRFLATERIDRIEAEGNYVRLHAGDETYLERRTLKSLEEQLDRSQFLRIHRSHVVHVDRVEGIEPRARGGYAVVLRDGTRLPLSRTYRKRLEKRIGSSL